MTQKEAQQTLQFYLSFFIESPEASVQDAIVAAGHERIPTDRRVAIDARRRVLAARQRDYDLSHGHLPPLKIQPRIIATPKGVMTQVEVKPKLIAPPPVVKPTGPIYIPTGLPIYSKTPTGFPKNVPTTSMPSKSVEVTEPLMAPSETCVVQVNPPLIDAYDFESLTHVPLTAFDQIPDEILEKLTAPEPEPVELETAPLLSQEEPPMAHSPRSFNAARRDPNTWEARRAYALELIQADPTHGVGWYRAKIVERFGIGFDIQWMQRTANEERAKQKLLARGPGGKIREPSHMQGGPPMPPVPPPAAIEATAAALTVAIPDVDPVKASTELMVKHFIELIRASGLAYDDLTISISDGNKHVSYEYTTVRYQALGVGAKGEL